MKNKETRAASSVRSGLKGKQSIMDEDLIKSKITKKNKSSEKIKNKSKGPTKTQIERMKVYLNKFRNFILIQKGFQIVLLQLILGNQLLKIMDTEILNLFMEVFSMEIICYLIISIQLTVRIHQHISKFIHLRCLSHCKEELLGSLSRLEKSLMK